GRTATPAAGCRGSVSAPSVAAGANRIIGAPGASGRRRLEGQREAVHAIAQAGRLGAVVKDMAEMAVAPVAGNRRSHHPVGPVHMGVHGIVERGPEARPAGAAVELGRRREQVIAAAGAGENALPLLMQKRRGERPLGPVLAEDRILIGGEPAAPFGVGIDEMVLAGGVRAQGLQEICARDCGEAAQSRSTGQHPSTSLALNLRNRTRVPNAYTFGTAAGYREQRNSLAPGQAVSSGAGS